MTSEPDYDPQADGVGSYYAAIENIRVRGLAAIKREVQIGDCRLILGDCLPIMPIVGRVAVVLSDPPYGIDYQSGYATEALWSGGNRIHGDIDLLERDTFVTEFMRLQPNVPMLLFGSRKRSVPPACRMVLTWDKGAALGMGALDLPWKPSSEEIYVIGRGFSGKRDESNVLYCPPVQSMAKNGRQHPNEKPVPLLRRLLGKSPVGTVLDPFAGSGSTGVACVLEGRPFIGIEFNETYFDIMCRRVSDAVSRPDFFAERIPEPIQQPLFKEATG